MRSLVKNDEFIGGCVPFKTIAVLSFLAIIGVFASLVSVDAFSKLIDLVLCENSDFLSVAFTAIIASLGCCLFGFVRKKCENGFYVSLLDSLQYRFLRKSSIHSNHSMNPDEGQHVTTESIPKICRFYVGSVPSYVAAVFQALVFFVLGVSISRLFAVLVLIFSILVVLWQNRAIGEVEQNFEDGERLESDFLGYVRRSVDNHEIIKAMLDESKIVDSATDRMKARNASWLSSLLPFFRTSSIGTATFQLTGFLSIVLGAFFYYKGTISIGEVFVFYQIASSITCAFEDMVGFFSSKAEYKGVLSFIGDVLRGYGVRDDDSFPDFSTKRDDIVLSDVSFKYPNGNGNAVCNASYRFEKGRLYCLRGANGSGKSTLGLLLAGKLHCTAGSILYPLDKVFYFGTESRFLPLSIAINIVGTSDSSAVQILKEKLEVIGGRLAENLSSRLLERIDVDGSPLSSGEKAFVSFVRAVHILGSLDEPTFAVFDETTATMDDDSKHRVVDYLKRLADEGHGVVFVTHDSFDSSCFDESLFMEEGVIV